MPTITIILEKIIRGGGEILYADVFDEIDDEFEIEFWNIGPTNEEVLSTLESVSKEVIQLGNYNTRDKYVLRPVSPIVGTLRSRDVDIVHGSSLYTNILAKMAGNSTQTAVVGQIHGYPKNRTRPVLLADLFTNRLADITITNSRAVANQAYGEPGSVRRFFSGGHITTVPCGIDSKYVGKFENSSLPDRKELDDLREGVPTIVNVGRLIEAKNQTVLLQALSKIDSFEVDLVIIGGGPKENQLKSYVDCHNIRDQTHFLGNIPRDDVLKVVSNADLFVSASVREGFGISVIEALFLGTPTLLSDIPAYQELFDHSIVPDEIDIHLNPYDSELWAKKIEQFFCNNQTNDEMERLCKQIVVDNYTISKIAREYERIYTNILH